MIFSMQKVDKQYRVLVFIACFISTAACNKQAINYHDSAYQLSAAGVEQSGDQAVDENLANVVQENSSQESAVAENISAETDSTFELNLKLSYDLAGDGNSDDTAMLLYALRSNPGVNLLLPKGNYLISKLLSIPDGTRLRGENATIIYRPRDAASGSQIMGVGSNTQISGLKLNGNKQASYGIWIKSHSEAVTIKEVELYNLAVTSNNSSGAVQGIRVSPGARNIKLDRVNIHNLFAKENGIQADSFGSVRAIWVGQAYDVYITNCNLSYIQGYEDGDAIQVQADLSENLNVNIENCLISEFGKRGIKIQASGVTVKNNTITSSNMDFISRAKVPADEVVLGVHSGISVIGRNNFVVGNNLQLHVAFTTIDAECENSTIEGNNAIIYGKELFLTSQPKIRRSFVRSFYLTNSHNCKILSNTFSSPVAGMHIRNSKENTIQDNHVGYGSLRGGIIYNIYWEEGTAKDNVFLNNRRHMELFDGSK